MHAGYWWLIFGLVGGLLPAFLLVRAVMHILNIEFGSRHRGES